MSRMKLTAAPPTPPAPDALALSFTGAARASGAPLAGYKLAYRAAPPGGYPPARCGAGAPKLNVTVIPVPGGAGAGATPIMIRGLAAGRRYRFRLCAFDAAGNHAAGIVAAGKTAG
ncbi:hypothetical protein MNEG_10856 [Monoraphidium neglectum]|uniref:Fibronectin type-III domain-containing protein n=1 Tax=Monoraphidium neglectum TaxID=145388 RepID=A0A0D2MR99_9CHLO|nr:hypothetical protein MNEG_10856 [Monoraphidium neglectum]KIY97105.1 hypothetical protein MNEG_10856 [Monoraphidium neglectum]|eukprot:XP_013896125.1 hypothetical protein MNEG_10856 [Monoraphidium neglectum]